MAPRQRKAEDTALSEKPSATRRGITVAAPIATAPAHSIEAEQSTLGGLMLDKSDWPAVCNILSEQDFYRAEHRLIFGAIRNLATQGFFCDPVTVGVYLESAGTLAQAGGIEYLGALARDTPSAAIVTTYAAIVHKRSLERQIKAAAARVSIPACLCWWQSLSVWRRYPPQGSKSI